MARGRAHLWLVVAFICGATAPAWADSGISGTYVTHAVNGSVFLELVETDHGHLSGRYEQVVIDPAGKLQDMNAAVAGAINGESVAVSIKPDGFLTTPLSASGTFDGTALVLSGGETQGAINLSFHRGDMTEFRQQVASLEAQANRINAARARAESLRRQEQYQTETMQKLADVTSKMRDFVARSPSPSGHFPVTEERMREVTERMRRGLERERSIWGIGQASLARGQVSLAIGQLALVGNNLVMQYENARNSYNGVIRSLQHEWQRLLAPCLSTPLPVSLNSACTDAQSAARAFDGRVNALREAFTNTGEFLKAEHQTQQYLQQEASAVVYSQ